MRERIWNFMQRGQEDNRKWETYAVGTHAAYNVSAPSPSCLTSLSCMRGLLSPMRRLPPCRGDANCQRWLSCVRGIPISGFGAKASASML